MSAIGAVLEDIGRLLSEVEKRVEALAKPISGEPFGKVGFVDGSYAMDERRGVYLLVLSAASLVVEGDRMEGVLKGSRRPHVLLLIPKSYAESRASLLMSIFELLGALDLVGRGVEAVFLDGSYVSEMMVPFSHARDAYENFSAASRVEPGTLEKWGEASAKAALEAAGGEPLRSLAKLLDDISLCRSELYGELCGESPDLKCVKEALDFAVVYCETTAYLALLDHFLRECGRRGVKPFWVAKDAESRYIVEREGVLGWLNDLSLLDYAWRGWESAYTLLKGVKIHKPKPCAVWAKLLDRVYGEWGGYGVGYFKLSRAGAVSQVTYPGFVPEDAVLSALATLLFLADRRGYPRPLSYVHHIAVLNPEFARLLADELYKRQANPILKSMLAPSGRVAAGLR